MTNWVTLEYVVRKSLAMSLYRASSHKTLCMAITKIEFRKYITCIFFELNQLKKSFRDSSLPYCRVSKVFSLFLLVEKWNKNYFPIFEKEFIVLRFRVQYHYTNFLPCPLIYIEVYQTLIDFKTLQRVFRAIVMLLLINMNLWESWVDMIFELNRDSIKTIRFGNLPHIRLY